MTLEHGAPAFHNGRDKPEQELVDNDYKTTTYTELNITFGGWLWKSEECD